MPAAVRRPERPQPGGVVPENWKPEGHTSVAPYLVTAKPLEVIEFLRNTLDAVSVRRYETADGDLLHGEYRIDDTVVMLAAASVEWPAVACHLHVYVPDVDAAYAMALKYGGEPVQAPEQQTGDPDRRCGVRDPGGNTWWLATQMES
jgi:PhnB protein